MSLALLTGATGTVGTALLDAGMFKPARRIKSIGRQIFRAFELDIRTARLVRPADQGLN